MAFLNYKEGGYIYIGIDKDGSTVGVSDVDDCMLRLKDCIKHNISPSAMGLFDIAEEQKDGRSIIKVTVASGIEQRVCQFWHILFIFFVYEFLCYVTHDLHEKSHNLFVNPVHLPIFIVFGAHNLNL